MRCWLRSGSREVEVHSGRTLIGRHDSCQVIIDDPLASRRHAALEFDGYSVTVHDLFDERLENCRVGFQDYDYCGSKDVLCVIEGEQKVYTCCTLTGDPRGLLGWK